MLTDSATTSQIRRSYCMQTERHSALSSLTTVRSISTALCCLAVGSAFAQSEDSQKILEAYGNLQRFPTFTLEVTGSEDNGITAVPYAASYTWYSTVDESEQPLAQLNAAEYRDSQLLWRSVADGVTLWSYNPKRNEYAANNYGAYGPQQPQTYRGDLIRSLYGTARGPAVWSARLFRDLFGADVPVYNSWSPGALVRVLVDGQGSTTDAITGVNYTPTPVRDYVIYEYGTPVRRSIVFERGLKGLPDGTEAWTITAIYVNEKTTGPSPRLTELTLVPTVSADEPPVAFAFQPPAGARTVSGSRIIR